MGRKMIVMVPSAHPVFSRSETRGTIRKLLQQFEDRTLVDFPVNLDPATAINAGISNSGTRELRDRLLACIRKSEATLVLILNCQEYHEDLDVEEIELYLKDGGPSDQVLQAARHVGGWMIDASQRDEIPSPVRVMAGFLLIPEGRDMWLRIIGAKSSTFRLS